MLNNYDFSPSFEELDDASPLLPLEGEKEK